MGIYHLQSFMTNSLPNGTVDISIIEECQKYSGDNRGKKPTIVIDLSGFFSIINADEVHMLYGRSHRQCFEIVDNLLRRIKEVADLVIYQDGPVDDLKADKSMKRKNIRYTAGIHVIDKINQNIPIAQIVKELRWIKPSVCSGFEILSMLSQKYGKLFISTSAECHTEIAKFACNNSSVIAILAENTDFLIFPGKWRYFSTHNINLENLTTIEYSRSALRDLLQLDDRQMAIFATIAGNDVLTVEEVGHCHGHKIGNQLQVKDFSYAMNKFTKIAEKIHSFEGWRIQGLIPYLSTFLLRDKSSESQQKVTNSIDQFDVHSKIVEAPLTPQLKFCIENKLGFIESVLRRKPFCMAVGVYDRREVNWPNIYEVLEKLAQRQLGIVQCRRDVLGPNPGAVPIVLYAKRSHKEQMQRHLILPIHPDLDVDDMFDFIQLLDRENFPQLDTIRFQLLKWTISDTLKDINLTSIPKIYLRHVLTLYFMVAEGFITKFDADIILLVIKDEAEDKISKNYEYPPVVDPSAFQIVFLFLTYFTELEKSFEVVGLLNLSTHQTFEGGWFHKTYLQFSSTGRNPAHELEDIEEYRIYKDLPDKASAISLKGFEFSLIDTKRTADTSEFADRP